MEINKIYQTCYPIVKSFVLQSKGTEADAQDIFQEAISIAWYNYRTQKFDTDKGSFDAYLITIAKNKWIDQLRKNKKIPLDFKEEFAENFENSPTDFLEIEEKIEKLLFTFQQIGDKCKDILHSYYYKKQRLEMIAERLNTNADVVKTQKSRCMKKLKELMCRLVYKT